MHVPATDLLTPAWARPGAHSTELIKELQEKHSTPEPLEQGRAPEADGQQGCPRCLRRHTKKPKGKKLLDGEVKIRFQDGFNSGLWESWGPELSK